MGQVAKHVIFFGNVQGVGFRFTAFNAANRHKLTGTVRNLRDGTVEMIVQGTPDDIDNCIREIQQEIGNYIRETKAEEIPLDPQYKTFKITF
jgi:acylphosphatase